MQRTTTVQDGITFFGVPQHGMVPAETWSIISRQALTALTSGGLPKNIARSVFIDTAVLVETPNSLHRASIGLNVSHS